VSGRPIAEVLGIFCGRFFQDQFGAQDGASTDLGLANGFTRGLNQPCFGIVPLNYRLRNAAVSAGTATGNITFTVVSTI